MTATDFILTDTSGRHAKYCPTHGVLMGSQASSHDECGTEDITFERFWQMVTVPA